MYRLADLIEAEMEELAQERAYTIIYNKLIRPYQKANENGTLNNDDYNAQKAAISADLGFPSQHKHTSLHKMGLSLFPPFKI